MTTQVSPSREGQPSIGHPPLREPRRLRVLLLGANGFMGGHVLRALLARGCEVVAVRAARSRRGRPVRMPNPIPGCTCSFTP